MRPCLRPKAPGLAAGMPHRPQVRKTERIREQLLGVMWLVQVCLSPLETKAGGRVQESNRPMTVPTTGGAPTPSSTRWFCPVASCPHNNQGLSQGCCFLRAMRGHLNKHSWVGLAGLVPQEFLDNHCLAKSEVCAKFVCTRFGNVCPKCRQATRQPEPRSRHIRCMFTSLAFSL